MRTELDEKSREAIAAAAARRADAGESFSSPQEPVMDPAIDCLTPVECERDEDCGTGATCTQCQCVQREVMPTGCDGISECTSDADCADYQACERCTCVGEGLLRFTLAWDSDTDFDLHVITPSGEEILWLDPFEMDGRGELDVDDVRGGPGSVENVYFWDPLPGRYQYFVRHFDPLRDPGTIEATVYRQGQQVDRITQTLGSYQDTPLRSITY